MYRLETKIYMCSEVWGENMHVENTYSVEVSTTTVCSNSLEQVQSEVTSRKGHLRRSMH